MRNGGPVAVVAGIVGLSAAANLIARAVDYVEAHLTGFIVAGCVIAAGFAAYRLLRAVAAARAEDYETQLAQHIDETDGMTGPQFERWCARLLRRSGLRCVRVVGESGDRGADIIGYAPGGAKVVVQCKRWTGSVGDPEIQKFNGTVWHVHDADVALFLTTGRPTARAWELAGLVGITIVDRRGLAKWAAGGTPPVPGLRGGTEPWVDEPGPSAA